MNEAMNSEYEVERSGSNNSSYENSFCVKKDKRLKLKLKKERIYRQKNHGSWSDEEEQKFVNYMKANRDIFEDK